MTAKLIALLRMAPGQTRETFRNRYETRHAPFIRSVMPNIVAYRRNYFAETIAGFDVLTEICFASEQSYRDAMAVAGTSPTAEQIAEDETGLFDRSATVMTLVEVNE